MSSIVIDQATVDSVVEMTRNELAVIENLKRLGAASKAFALSYKAGRIIIMTGKPQAYALDVLSKAAPLLKDAEPKAKAKRREDIKAGKTVERTADEQRLYNAAGKSLSLFLRQHTVKPANKKRGSAAKGEAPTPAKDATPKAINAKQADAYIRMQAAVLKAYAEKNRTILPDALRFAIMEFAEAVDTVPVALSDAETK